MPISDWGSDVRSSDLAAVLLRGRQRVQEKIPRRGGGGSPRAGGEVMSIRPLKNLVAALALGSALGACSMMPAYERPVAPTPSVWPKGEAYGTGENAAAASGADAHSLGWEAFFRAPELQALIRTALDNNRD